MNRFLVVAISFLVAAMIAGCNYYRTSNVEREDAGYLEQEGNIVFVRPTGYWPLIGTKTLQDYVRVTHEQASVNDVGLLQVSIGLRDIGGAHFWDLQGHDFPLSVKTAFYNQPFYSNGQTSVPIYETNWQTIKMLRGATTEYKVICPKKEGRYYQVTISELLH